MTSARPRCSALSVLRISHSSVVAAWRQREQWLRHLGLNVSLLTAKQWPEGGSTVVLRPGPGEQVVGASALGRHPCGFLYSPLALWRALGSRPYEILDLQEEPYSVAALEVTFMRRWAGLRQPLVFYSAQNLPKRHSWPVRLAEKVVFSASSGAYPCNQGAAANLRRKGFRGIVRVIPLGHSPVPPGTADRAGHELPSGRGLRVGCAGRLVPEKGFEVAIDAMAAEPRWSLSIAGDGPERGNLEARARLAGVRDRVNFLGYCDERAMDGFFRAVDVLVVPSLPTPGWAEQFGRVAAEAMARGLPVVSSDSGSLPEVVGDAGAIVAAGEPRALHDALAALDDDPGLRALLGARGVERAQRYTWEAVARQQRDFYLSVLGLAGDALEPSGAQTPGLDVVMVAYGRPELVEGALAALAAEVEDAAPPIVTVVDNSSDLGVRGAVERRGARYIDAGGNIGFAAAVNLALGRREDPASDVLLLNPDAEVDLRTVRSLQKRLHAEARLACVAPAQFAPAGDKQRVAWPFPTPGRYWLEAVGLSGWLRQEDFLTGSVLLLNGAALGEVGHLDASFFLYAEEADWQRRARGAGWGARFCQDLKAVHAGAATSAHPGLRELRFAAGQEHYLRKWHGPLGWQASRAAVVIGALARAALLPGDRRLAAAKRAWLYLAGPSRLLRRRRGTGGEGPAPEDERPAG